MVHLVIAGLVILAAGSLVILRMAAIAVISSIILLL